MSKTVCIVGAGGHGKVIAEILVARGAPPSMFLDEAPKAGEILGIPVRRPEDAAGGCCAMIIGVGDNFVRERLAARYGSFATAIHPSAVIGADVEIGHGSVVMAGVVINTGTRIGKHCILNTRASIDHDCAIGDFAHIGPGATLGGAVRVGHGSHVALGANVIHGIQIGDHTILGAGATAMADLPDNVVAFGVPARIVRGRAPGDQYL